MTPTSKIFTSMLCKAALVAALLSPALPAHAEVVTLICQGTPGGSFTLRIDYDRRTAAMLNGDGTVYISAPADITDAQVWWDAKIEEYSGYKFNGRVNRLSGDAWVMFPGNNGGNQLTSLVVSGPCRRATQKF